MKKDKQIQIETKRHSLSHILAMAVLELFPGTKLGIGPAIESGFYYDFDSKTKITESDLPRIEKRMKESLGHDITFVKKEIKSSEAEKIFAGQPYKLELIKELEKEKTPITIYYTGSKKVISCQSSVVSQFIDLCAGPHVKSTKEIAADAFKLTRLAGAYWRGDEKNPMLQRIYGLAFSTRAELESYLKLQEEARKRDHKKLGRELEFFIFSDLVGPGLPLYTFKGALVRRIIQDYSSELRKEIGYQEVHTPQMNKAELFKVSGHYDKYKDGMFRVISNYTDEEYFLKPMNCPQHVQIYASKPRSYRDLPIRIADFANLYRDEKPGELSGLARLRAFSQDDGHCFCREDQIKNEFDAVLKVIKKAMKRYGLNYYIRLSLRDEKNKSGYLGDDATWKKSQKLLDDLLKERKIEYVLAEGEAAFYGPKMDLMVKDSLDREWQLSTIQLDFNMPQRFDLEYIGQDGKKHTPVMIHSAIVGSPERFLGILLEHFAGALPTWLMPVQAAVIPIAERHNAYARKIGKLLDEAGVRQEVCDQNETVSKKIRAGELQKIPYLLVVGDKEMKAKTAALRIRGKGDVGAKKIDAILKLLTKKSKPTIH